MQNQKQVYSLIADGEVFEALNPTKKNAWLAFVDIVHNFLANHRVDNYKDHAPHAAKLPHSWSVCH